MRYLLLLLIVGCAPVESDTCEERDRVMELSDSFYKEAETQTNQPWRTEHAAMCYEEYAWCLDERGCGDESCLDEMTECMKVLT